MKEKEITSSKRKKGRNEGRKERRNVLDALLKNRYFCYMIHNYNLGRRRRRLQPEAGRTYSELQRR